jgi:anti-anti-sigma factor
VANLDIQHTDRTLESGSAATFISLSGSIDSSTSEQMDTALGELLAGDAPLAALDFAGIEYVNSRGMSILIKHHDAVKRSGGTMVLVAVPRKIVATFDLMGLTSTFNFVDDENSALARLAQPDGGAPAAAEGSFPWSFSCDSCAATLTADAPGKYRCPRCQSCFEVTPAQEILLFPVRSAQMVELLLPCRAKYAEVARSAAMAISKDLDLSSISSELLDRAVDEAMGLYAGKSASGNGRLRVFVAADNREFSVAFLTTDPGLELTDEDEQGLTIRTLRGFVDVVEVVPLSPDGQILRLVKKMQD